MVWTDDDVERLIDSYAVAAGLASDVGFGFVDIKACHGYLLHEFLSARARPGKFGGDFEGRTRLLTTIVRRMRAEYPDLARIPGVEYAGAANLEPFGALSMSTLVRTQDDPDVPTGAGWVVASPGYFRAMGISLVFGRGFTPQDDASAAGVIIVSRSMAQQLWPDPILWESGSPRARTNG